MLWLNNKGFTFISYSVLKTLYFNYSPPKKVCICQWLVLFTKQQQLPWLHFLHAYALAE